MICYKCLTERGARVYPCPEHPGWTVQAEPCARCGVEVFYSPDPYGIDRPGIPGPDGKLYCPNCLTSVRARALTNEESGADEKISRARRRLEALKARFHCAGCGRALPVVMDRDVRRAAEAVRSITDLLNERTFMALENAIVAGIEYRQYPSRFGAGGWTVKHGVLCYSPSGYRDDVLLMFCLSCAPRTGDRAGTGQFWVYRDRRLDIVEYEPPQWLLEQSSREEEDARGRVGDLLRIYGNEIVDSCPIRLICGC